MVLKILISQILARFSSKFAIVFKFFKIFHHVLSLLVFTTFFLSLANGLHDRSPETKSGFEHFCEIWKLSFQFF